MDIAASNMWNKTNRAGLFTQGQKLLKISKISLKKDFFKTTENLSHYIGCREPPEYLFIAKRLYQEEKLFHVHLRPSWQAHDKLHHPTASLAQPSPCLEGTSKSTPKYSLAKMKTIKFQRSFTPTTTSQQHVTVIHQEP